MNPKNNFRFKPHIYENQLSPFGKIVLKNLIKIRENKNELIKPAVAEQMKYSNHVFVHNSNPNYRNKKILNFREEKDVISSSELLGLPYHSDYPDKVCSRGNESHNNLKRQSPEMELLAFPDAINDSYTHLNSNKQDYELYSTNKETFDSNLNITSESRDLLASKLSTNDFVPKILEDTEFDLGFFNNDAEVNNDLNNASGGIVWNDIVDTQLFDDNNNLNSEKVEKLQNPVIINENLLQMRTPLDADIGKTTKAVNNIDSKSKKKKKQSKVKTPDAIPTSSKRKCAKITDSIPKKIKKPQNSVMAFPKDVQRKKKTNTNVQNWLDEMDPDNLIEEGSCEDILTINKNVEKINDRINIGFDSKPICNKKKVQAQLTNKDGIMKYDKPKNSAIDLTNDVDKVTTETKVTTQKKSKLKFVVPIKSQVPVKEIVYDIFNIDCNSVINRSFDLRISGSEVFMVLTYSNGFNQLNGQFTEDVCLPEAMMLLINDNFYYLKGKDFNIMDDIAALVKKNSVICYGGKSVLKYLAFNFNIDVYEVNILDLKIGGSLMDPDNPPENFSNLQKLLGLSIQYTIANDCSLQKAAWYLTLLKEATPRLTSLLKENSLWKVFIDIEMAVMPIIASMEIRGIVVDSEKLQSMEANILSKIKKIEQDCYKAAGKKFQINSTVQVRAILYDELQLDTKSNVKIKETVCQGAKSTSETMLRSLTAVHPLPKLILDYRQLHKAHATFLVGISQQVKDGLLRPTWEQTAAATGRIAANNPNIQAIPKAEINLNDLVEGDQDAAGPQQLNFRSIYTSRPGFILLAADFNHVECRVFAHAAADESLLELLATGRDLFRVLASKWLNKSEESITSEDRERTKRIVYASLYGAGARKLTDILGVSYDQALTVFSSFNRTFPSLKSFGRSVVSRCSREGGSLSTLCGRVRRFANIDSSDATLKAQAERQAVNFIVQGSAADLCKLAMVSSVQHLRTAGVEAHLLLQIHDELVWEIRQEQLHIAAGIIKSSMEECGVSAGAGGTLPVTLHTGQCWGYMTTYNTH